MPQADLRYTFKCHYLTRGWTIVVFMVVYKAIKGRVCLFGVHLDLRKVK